MKKNKQERYFDKITEFKMRFEKRESDYLKNHLNRPLIKEAAIAIQQILEERNEI